MAADESSSSRPAPPPDAEPAPRARAAPAAPPRLRGDLPFRRIALVLSGGGALGAYEIGALKVLEALGVRPALIAGVSIGAINAVGWIAHGFRTAPLEAVWRAIRASSLGLRWMTLALRWAGAAALLVAGIELVMTLAGSRELSGAYWLWKKSSGRLDLASAVLDATAWLVVAAGAALVIWLSRPIEDLLSRLQPVQDPGKGHRVLGRVLLALLAVHVVVWVFAWPWPHRFSASLLLGLGVLWFASRPGREGGWMRAALFSLMPETRGLGLWSSSGRRRAIEQLAAGGDLARLTSGETRLVVSALALDTGRVCHFVNWRDPDAEFVAALAREAGEVRVARDPEDVVRAALASSAIPGVFEPVRIEGRAFVDAGGFSNQPLHVALADRPDAVIVVLLSPAEAPAHAAPPGDLIDLAGRLLEVSNWRDMQNEMRNLPSQWMEEARPRRVLVIGPDRELAGGVMGFDPANAASLVARGEHDARAAFGRAGWLAGGE